MMLDALYNMVLQFATNDHLDIDDQGLSAVEYAVHVLALAGLVNSIDRNYPGSLIRRSDHQRLDSDEWQKMRRKEFVCPG